MTVDHLRQSDGIFMILIKLIEGLSSCFIGFELKLQGYSKICYKCILLFNPVPHLYRDIIDITH